MIKTKCGAEILISDCDAELSKYTWHVMKTAQGKRYIRRWEGKPKRAIYLHREIMNCPKGLDVDHINNNSLDNRRENLRICTRQENTWNRKQSKHLFVGVSFTKTKRWHVQITNPYNKKRIHLGDYYDLQLALEIWDVASKDLHGEFAKQNLANDKRVYDTKVIDFYLDKYDYYIKKTA